MFRLFRTIDREKNAELAKVASLIIDDEKRKGHSRLAEKLNSIISKDRPRSQSVSYELKQLRPSSIPTDKRNNIPLAIKIPREQLRHEMVLDESTEMKIRTIEKEFAAKERLAHFGLQYRRKILIYGSPGCGKSMSAERMAWNLGLPFLKVRFDVMISSFLGETATNLSRLFDGVKDYPCVLLLDEIDIVGKTRIRSQDVGEMHRIVNILLTLLEDFNSQGLLIATTNVEKTIDHALFRRFDDIIELPKPSRDEIKRLAKMTVSSIRQSTEISWDLIVNRLIGTSSAIVVKVANDAAKLAVIGNEQRLNQSHFEKSLEENDFYLK